MSTILTSLPFPPQFSDDAFQPIKSVELEATSDRLRDVVEVWATAVRLLGMTVEVDQMPRDTLQSGICIVIVTDDCGHDMILSVGVRGQFPRFA